VDSATVLLAGAEVSCCAAAARTRDEDKTTRESRMVEGMMGQSRGEKEETGR
jgi:hypothetical protein